MLERFRHWLKKETPTQKPVIITIHGYGRRRKHEFDNLLLWGKEDGYDIVSFDMYDLFNEQDHDWKQWVKRAKDKVDMYHLENREIYLVGFSMGGVIAAYLASVCDVKKLVLLSPAFQYLNFEMISDVLVKSASSLISNEKKEEIPLSRYFYSAFTDVVKNLKKYIEQVKCPVLMIHGDEDEVISYKSSLYAFDKIPHDQKKLILLHGGHHRLLMDEAVNWECYQLMKLFFEGQIVLTAPKPMAADVMEDLLKKYHELHPVDTKDTQEKKD